MSLTLGPDTRQVDLCGEHFHDIDWEVIQLSQVVAEAQSRGVFDSPADRGAEKEATDDPRQDDPVRSSRDRSN